MTTIYFLGPRGTFSEIAASKAADLLGDAAGGETVLTPCNAIQEVAARVGAATSADQAVSGVVPYYNLLEGLVQESIDSIAAHPLTIIGLLRIPIVFCSAIPKDPSLEAITEIASHPKALAQCSDYLGQAFPHAVQTPVSSTAEGVALAAGSTSIAALASRAAIEQSPLRIIQEDVGNKRHGLTNFTDFFCVVTKRRWAALPPVVRSANRSIISIAPDRDAPGLLSNILSLFALFEINLAKIHSRPSAIEVDTGGHPQMFYVEADVGPENEALASCISALKSAFHRGGGAAVLGGFVSPE